MVDLTRVTNFNRTQAELEEFWLVTICVAGKNGPVQARKVHEFLTGLAGDTPFDKIRRLIVADRLLARLQEVKMGQYNRVQKAFTQSLLLNLTTATLADLLAIPGVGGKTARFFLLHSRAGFEHIVLDTHILRFLREVGRLRKIPASTPSTATKYNDIERRALPVMRRHFPNLTIAEADLKIWVMLSGHKPLDSMD
ncbi:MAG TPA: hypothetical protein VF607_12505 [Verrucomicrobiae bacterium]